MPLRVKGLLFALGSAILFGLSPIWCKYTYDAGGTPMSVTFLRAIVSIAMMLILILKNKVSLDINQKEASALLLAGLLGISFTGLFLSGSYLYIDSGFATTLHFIYPLLTALCGWVFFHEIFSLRGWIALCLMSFGIILFAWGTSSLHWSGVFLALASGVTYTFYIVFLAHSCLKQMNVFLVTFYCCIIMAVAAGVGSLIQQETLLQLAPLGWFCATANGICAALATVWFQLGVRYAGGAMASTSSALEPATSVLLGAICFGEGFQFYEIAGCMAVCLGVILLLSARKNSKVSLSESPCVNAYRESAAK